MSSTDKRLWVVAGFLFIVAAVLGIWTFWPTDDPSSSTKQSADPTGPSGTPTPSQPKPPTLPLKASQKTVDGAKATLDYFYDALNYLRATGNADPYRRAADLDNCTRCADTIYVFSEVYRQGGHVTGSESTIASITNEGVAYPSDDTMAYTATVTTNRAAGVTYDGTGTVRATGEARQESGPVDLYFNGDQWQVVSFGEETA